MPAGEPRCNGESGVSQIAGERLGKFEAGTRGVARTDDPDHRPHLDLARAAHTEQRRRIVDQCEARRVAILPRRQQRHAHAFAACDLAGGFVVGADPSGSRRASASCQLGQVIERGACAAVVIDERAEGTRSDIVAADQAQPVNPLRVGQPDDVRCLCIHPAPQPGRVLRNSSRAAIRKRR